MQVNEDGEANQNAEQGGAAVAATDASQEVVGANVAVLNQENDGIKTNQNAEQENDRAGEYGENNLRRRSGNEAGNERLAKGETIPRILKRSP